MKKTFIWICISIFAMSNANAQDVSLDLQKRPLFDTIAQAAKWNGMKNKVDVSFGNSNTRYAQDVFPEIKSQNNLTLTAWKGEKLNAQIMVWAKTNVPSIRVAITDLKSNNGHIISKSNSYTGFVDYVITDEFKGGCGYRKPENFDSSLVADPINTMVSSVALKKNTVQPIWVSINVPSNAPEGNYVATVTVNADKSYQLKLNVKVVNKTLPAPSQWVFNLDFWQHPAAIARVHNEKLWSDAHFASMKKYYTMLANAGQKNITASIVNEPWGHQTYDDYPSLIKWIKKKDGSWVYDYSLFDKYISFVMSCGINQRINCYSMVPWKVAFQYYDEGLAKDTVFTEEIGSEAYNVFWSSMLKDFTKHLKQKGWFSITAIAMDERPMPAMQSVIKLLKEIDKDWKITLAGDYHPEIEKDIFDYCIASRWSFPEDVLQLRQQQGKLSTWYTCCTEKYPNGFTFSPPAEHVWLGWYTAAKNMDGYLRWAYNSWPKEPLKDSRFTAWPAGDTYQVYPGPMTSIRFEKLIEGIQDFEKIRILKEQYKKNGEEEKLKKLEIALMKFEIEKLSQQTAEEMVKEAKLILNVL
ncbi:glycoside hydrolase domain-containing protein [Flavobacterium sp. W1B]|uniref:glycoside hydrolase domain-containing protein n=1 Tax=Flavobacterium sp. W1B TaxID=3394146 RepID=UPI0039BCD484